MKKYMLFPLLAITGSAAAFVLRLMQNRTGYESTTGLPIAGNIYGYAVPAVLAVLAVLMLLLVRRIPGEKSGTALPFAGYFRSAGAGTPSLLVIGAFLWIGSGALNIFNGLSLSQTNVLTNAASSTGLSSSLSLFLTGMLNIISGLCILPVISACRYRGRRSGSPGKAGGGLLLAPVACLVILLVITYREDSINPSLSVYYIELLAQAGLILSLYRTSSFVYKEGRTRRLLFYSLMTAILCITTLADSHTIAEMLFYSGGALLTLGLVLLRMEALVWAETPAGSDEP